MQFDWWTLALQTVNVLVLIWILGRYFFRPVADVVAKRQAGANKLLSDAAAAKKEAADARADVDKMRGEIGAERERLIAEAQKAAQSEKESLLAKASEGAAKLRGEAEAAIARDHSAAEQATIAHAGELAVDIAKRLLARLPAETAASAFLDGLCEKLCELPPGEKQGITSAADPVEVVTAAPLSNEEQEHVRTALKEALDAEIAFTFRSDAAVIAGIELESRNTIVRNSWRADLDKIGEALGRGQHHHQS
jgi:F-type H+-transporting ATPase subunit b